MIWLLLAAAAASPYRYVTVQRSIDGDTFQITNRWSFVPSLVWRIRPRGLDTPEVSFFDGAKCQAEIDKGKAAADFAAQTLAHYSMRVRLLKATLAHDKYGGRFDADVTFPDGQNYAAFMIQAGFAKPYFGGAKPDWCTQ